MSTPNEPTPSPLDTVPDKIPPELHDWAQELADRNVLGKGVLSPEIEASLRKRGQIWAAVTPEGTVVSCARHPALAAFEMQRDAYRVSEQIRADAARKKSQGGE